MNGNGIPRFSDSGYDDGWEEFEALQNAVCPSCPFGFKWDLPYTSGWYNWQVFGPKEKDFWKYGCCPCQDGNTECMILRVMQEQAWDEWERLHREQYPEYYGADAVECVAQ